MAHNDLADWDDLIRADLRDDSRADRAHVNVERRELEEIVSELSNLVFATERRYQNTADRFVYEHQERFRQDLIRMNNLRIRLRTLLRNST